MDQKKAKRIRAQLRAKGVEPTDSQYVLGKPPTYMSFSYDDDGVLQPDPNGDIWKKVANGTPTTLLEGCGRQQYKAAKQEGDVA